MTPKEKAKELVDKFYNKNIQNFWDIDEAIKEAKQCALICVDEIINASPSLPVLSDNGSYGSDIEESTKHWQEVEQEINKL